MDKTKLLSALCHGAIFFSATGISIGIPLVIFFVSDDGVVKENARESLNFHLNVFLYGLIFGILAYLLIGIPLLVLLGLVTLIMPIIAIIQVLGNPEKPFRYPFIFRIL